MYKLVNGIKKELNNRELDQRKIDHIKHEKKLLEVEGKEELEKEIIEEEKKEKESLDNIKEAIEILIEEMSTTIGKQEKNILELKDQKEDNKYFLSFMDVVEEDIKAIKDKPVEMCNHTCDCNKDFLEVNLKLEETLDNQKVIAKLLESLVENQTKNNKDIETLKEESKEVIIEEEKEVVEEEKKSFFGRLFTKD